ncbi:MAG: ATP-binding cassette domain-containing protein, partial [Coprobacillus cateniformis]
LLGPNGSGKSTLMNLLCQQLKPTTGKILWNEQEISKLGYSYYQILGYAPQQQGLYEEMSGLRFLTYMALLKDIPKKEIQQEVQRVAQLVNMQDHLTKKCRAYSGGMKQRLLVAQALLGNPLLLLFDEPTAGLDPKERVSLRNVFDKLSHNHILLIATHVVSDVETIDK